VAGVDEAGRGPLAGPVLVAAVILPPEWGEAGVPPEFLKLNDSKKLTADARSRFFDLITGHPDLRFAIVPVEPDVIDRINILAATHQGMNEALEGLTPRPLHALIDGNPVPSLRWPQTAIVKGDSLSYSIAAASVLAKVTRDRRMMEADLSYPGYGFAQHKGYPTAEHLAAIARLGPCPIHRRSFAPLRQPEPDLFTR
jgi:ribonuclease HII